MMMLMILLAVAGMTGLCFYQGREHRVVHFALCAASIGISAAFLMHRIPAADYAEFAVYAAATLGAVSIWVVLQEAKRALKLMASVF